MAHFTVPFGSKEGDQPVERNRYRLIHANPCPFAHRAIIARDLLGLEDVISIGKADAIKSEEGWAFTLDTDNRDPVLGVQYVKDIYLNSDPEYDGAFAVPVLVDETTGKIARKESADIVKDFSQDFKEFHGEDAPELYPTDKKKDIRRWNTRITRILLGNAYKMGTTEDPEEFEELSKGYFDFLDTIDKELENQRYLNGDTITASDIFLFTPLVRLDAAYASLFKVNQKKLTDYSNLWPYMRDLYQTKGFGSTTYFDGIQIGYYSEEDTEKPEPVDISLWNEPHNRENM